MTEPTLEGCREKWARGAALLGHLKERVEEYKTSEPAAQSVQGCFFSPAQITGVVPREGRAAQRARLCGASCWAMPYTISAPRWITSSGSSFDSTAAKTARRTVNFRFLRLARATGASPRRARRARGTECFVASTMTTGRSSTTRSPTPHHETRGTRCRCSKHCATYRTTTSTD